MAKALPAIVVDSLIGSVGEAGCLIFDFESPSHFAAFMSTTMMKVLSCLFALATVDSLNLRCQYYRWDSTEVKYVCKGDENAVTWSEDSASTPNLMYLGEFRTNLGVCQGRCRSDADCQDGLICIFRDPTVPIIDNHCANGHVHRFVNYCYYNDDEVQGDFVEQNQEEVPVDQLVYKGEPPFTSKLMECQGDCDTDWNCDFGLNCYKRSDDREIPGCEGIGIYSVDYCYVPPPDTLVLVIDAEAAVAPSQAGKCEGSCVDDSDCLVGLECFRRSNYEYVPGCRGLGAHATNYCFDPNDIVFPTAMPQVSPTAAPTAMPTDITDIPTEIPSEKPSILRSGVPSFSPSDMPTGVASSPPSDISSSAPTVEESRNPSTVPSLSPSIFHSQSPSNTLSSVPTVEVSEIPSTIPSSTPSGEDSESPSNIPSSTPTSKVSQIPSAVPSTSPTVARSSEPSGQPSTLPVSQLSNFSSQMPTTNLSETPTELSSSAPSALADKNIPTAENPQVVSTVSPNGFSGTERPTITSQNVVGGGGVSLSPTKSPSSLVPPLEILPSASSTPSPDSSVSISGLPSMNPTTVIPSSRPSDLWSDLPSSDPTSFSDKTIPTAETPSSLSPTGRPSSESQSAVDGNEPSSTSSPPALESESSDWPSMNPTVSNWPSISPPTTANGSSGDSPTPTSNWPSVPPTSVSTRMPATETPVLTPNLPSLTASPTIVPTLVPEKIPTTDDDETPNPMAVQLNPIAPVASPIAETTRPTMLSESIVGGDRDQTVETTSPAAVPTASSTNPTALSCNQDPDMRAQDLLLELSSNGFDMNLKESTMAFYWLISEEITCPETRNIVQRFTMATLYYSLSGWNCTETNTACFLSEAPECTWDGVQCNDLGEVSNLRLDDLDLAGSLPNLSSLSSLVELDMDSNMLSGSIPTWIGDLRALEILDLDSNKLTGYIPTELGDSSLLRVIDLDGNQLVGLIPEEIGLLEKLYFLQLDFNQLTGSVPSSIASVQSLEYLSLLGNNFTEPLSIDFCDRQLELYSNCEMCSIAECCTACLVIE